MDGRVVAGSVLAVVASVLGGLGMVHARSAGERAREAESRLEDLTARLEKLERVQAGPEAGTERVEPRRAEVEQRMEEKVAAGHETRGPDSVREKAGGAETPKDAASTARGRQAWASLSQDDRRAVLELVKEAQKEIRQEEVWGWAAGIQASFTKSLREKLQLTPQQEDRVSAVLKVYLPEMNKVWHSPEGTPEERAAKSGELWAKVDGEITPLLTGEQSMSYEAWRREQAERAKKHSEGK